MMFNVYLTYIDQYSPVYRTQVIEQCKIISANIKPIKLVAFVPISTYRYNKKLIHQKYSNSIVLPTITRLFNNALYNKIIGLLLLIITKPDLIITRSLYALPFLYLIKRKRPQCRLIYDARGAAAAEVKEYGGKDSANSKLLAEFEKQMLSICDHIFTVSIKLSQYFKNKYDIKSHLSTIPCCISSGSIIDDHHVTEAQLERNKLFPQYKTIFIYAGSLSVWNLPKVFIQTVNSILKDPENALIILSHELSKTKSLGINDKPNLILKSVNQSEVKKHLALADYGLLLRDKNITNNVACPSKFGEYLGAGLDVIISKNIGDLSEFVVKNNCGQIIDEIELKNLHSIQEVKRKYNIKLAEKYFLRNSSINIEKYNKAIK